MTYAEKCKAFAAAYPVKTLTVDGATYRYVRSGAGQGRAVVLLNGGMNVLEMWLDYVEPLAQKCDVLLFDYPEQLRTNQEVVAGMHAFFAKLGIEKPIFVGASDGGMVAQIYTQKYPTEVGGLVLVSTGGMDAATLKTLKKQYFFAPVALWILAHCNYEKMKPRLIKLGMSHLRDESAEEVAYAQGMFETIFKDYEQAHDVHITGLLADLMNQTPVTEADFATLAGRILLILPDQDFFSGQMQQDLIKLMHDPKIAYVAGGHLGTVLKADDYVKTILAFLDEMDG